jgi:hypothetical protein
MKRLWKKYVDYVTNKYIENYDSFAFAAVMFGLIAVADFGHQLYRHRTSLEDYWFGLSILLVVIVISYFLARARAVRRLRYGDSD